MSSEIRRPLDPTIELTLAREPEHSKFDRHLTFRNHRKQAKRLKVSFVRASGLMWRASGFPAGTDEFRSLADTGNRQYWDSMLLENRGGDTEIRVAHLMIRMHYDDIPSGCSTDIDILNADIGQTLASGQSSILLDPYARLSRMNWAGITGSAPLCVVAAAHDLGKSGSDGSDQYGSNPKYGGSVSQLCSEFVSWYYHEVGVVVGGKNFRDIVGAAQMHDIFSSAKQLYRYHSGKRAFIHAETEAVYRPQAGDFLERRGPGGPEHSMMMLRWDDAAKEATVINGPWPVTLRKVRVEHSELNQGKDYWVGRLEPE